MVLLVFMLAIGAVVAILSGGSLHQIRRLSAPKWVAGMLAAAGAGHIAATRLSPQARTAIGWPMFVGSGIVAMVALIACAWQSEQLRRAAFIALGGAALNAAVMVPNGGMPVSMHAAAQLGLHTSEGHEILLPHVEATRSSTMSFLGDIIPVRFGPDRGIFSVGDLLLYLAAIVGAYDAVKGSGSSSARWSLRDPVANE